MEVNASSGIETPCTVFDDAKVTKKFDDFTPGGEDTVVVTTEAGSGKVLVKGRAKFSARGLCYNKSERSFR